MTREELSDLDDARAALASWEAEKCWGPCGDERRDSCELPAGHKGSCRDYDEAYHTLMHHLRVALLAADSPLPAL